MAAFSFAYNPFVVLPVSLRASAQEVEEAYQRRLAARPQSEAALSRARRLLLDPASRLAAEVAWLADASPREAATLLGAMASGDETGLLAALDNQPALTKANVAADACARLKSTAFLAPLAEAHRRIDPSALTGLFDEIHAAIPLTGLSARHVEAALSALDSLHAGAALEAIDAQADPHAALAEFTAAAGDGPFVQAVTEAFSRRHPWAEAESPTAPGEPATAAPAPQAFADVHAAEQGGWGEGEAGAAAAASAFMDAQLIFTAHERFDTWGSSRRVRRVLYVLGGALAAAVLVILIVTRPNYSDDAANNAVADPPAVDYAKVKPPPLPVSERHAAPQCVHVSGAVYCTSS